MTSSVWLVMVGDDVCVYQCNTVVDPICGKNQFNARLRVLCNYKINILNHAGVNTRNKMLGNLINV